MDDKVKDLYNILKQSKDFANSFANEDELRSTLSTDEGVKGFYDALNLSDEFKGMFKDSDEFSDTFSLKKKGISLESVAKGETLGQTFGIESEKPLLQPQPLPSGEPPITQVNQQPLTQPSDVTAVNQVLRPTIPQPKEEVLKQGKDEANTLGEWLTAIPGTLDKLIAGVLHGMSWLNNTVQDAAVQLILGKKAANKYQELKDKGKLGVANAILNPSQQLADLVIKSASGTKELPSGNNIAGVVGQSVKGILNVAPDIALATFMPEIAAPKFLADIGIKNIGKFGIEQGLRGLIEGGENAQNLPVEQQLSMPIINSFERGMAGWMFEGLSGTSNDIGINLANRFIPKPQTYAEGLNKALIEHGTSSLANGMFFMGYGGMDEYLRTGRITSETLFSNLGMGVGMSMPVMGKLLLAKGLTTLLGMPKQGMNNAINSNLSSKELADKATELATKVDNKQSDNPQGDAVMSFMLAKSSQVKAVADEVNNNPEGVKKTIDESTLDPKVKEALTDKVDEIVHDNSPRFQAVKEQSDKIAEINDKLDKISSNKASTDEEKAYDSAPLKEEKKVLQEKVNEILTNFKEEEKIPKEEIGKTSFIETKEGQDWYNVVNKDGQKDTFSVPEGSSQDIVEQAKNKLGGTENAESNGGSTEKVSEQAQGLEQGAEERLHLRKNEVNGLETQQGEEIKTPTLADKYDVDNKLTDFNELKEGDYAIFTNNNDVLYEGEVVKKGRTKITIKTKSDMYGEQELTFTKDQLMQFVKPKPESPMDNPEGEPKGVQEQIKEFKQKGELQEGWEEALPTIPKKEVGTLSDGRKVFIVSGEKIRDKVYTNFTEGGNSSAYPWMNKGDIFVEDVEAPKDKIADLIHEAEEQKAMDEKGWSYDKAHEEAGLPAEKKFRETGDIPDYLKETADLLLKEPVAPLPETVEQPEITPKEAIPEATGEKTTEVPKEGESGSEGLKTGKNEVIPPEKPPVTEKIEEEPAKDEREKSLFKRMANAKDLSDDFKEGIKQKGMTYKAIPNTATEADVDYYISQRGLDGAATDLFDSSIKIEPRVRASLALRLMDAFDKLAIMSEKDGDKAKEAEYLLKSVDIANHIDEMGRDWGRGIQEFASAKANEILQPKAQVIRIKREARRQRDEQIKESGKDIQKKSKSLKEVQKQSIEDALKSKVYDKAKSGVTGKKGTLRPDVQVSREKIQKEKTYRQSQWDALKTSFKKPSGTASASAIGLDKEQIELVGNIVASYVREGYYRSEVLASKLKDDWKKAFGEELSDDDALKLIPEKIEGKLLSDLQKQGETIEASTKLANRVDRMLKDKSISDDDPVKQMVETLFGKVKEKDTKEKVPQEKKSDIDKIKESIENKEKYKDVWEQAKEEVQNRIENNEELSEEQKKEYTDRLQGFYDEVIGKPFSEKQTEGATKKAIKDLDISIDKVVKDHYTVYDATKRTLQEKLVDELGLSGDDAKLLSDAVGQEFDKIALSRKKAILKQGVTAKEIVHPKTAKQLHDKLIELTNLGAWSDADFAEAYADKWGFAKIEPEQAKELQRLTDEVRKAPDGFQKFEKVQNLLGYAENIKGFDMGDVGMSLWYSSILSGYRTQWKNVLQNSITSIFEYGIASLQHPLDVERNVKLFQGLLQGWGEGSRQFTHIMKTGYNPIKGYKVEVPNILERKTLSGGNLNPANWAKYVTRIMVAADAFSYGGLKEMRAYEIAMNEARKSNKLLDKPRSEDWAKATEILNKTSDRIKISEAQAEQEGMKIGSNEYKRRVWELMEQGRTKEMVEDAAHFAAHGTFNYKPEGALGMLTEAVGSMTQSLAATPKIPFTDKRITVYPVKFIIPFTRIIANVTNMALDYYPPIGLARAATGSIGWKGFEKHPMTKQFYREYTPEERGKVLTKAMIGLSAQIAMYLLTEPDDKGKSAIELSANGYGDFQKNYELKETGWQPYSIKIGDKWISYQYTPLVLTLAPIGYLRDLQKYHKEKVKEQTLASQIGISYFKGLQVINDMTWATSLSSLMSAISAKEPKQAESIVRSFAVSTAKGIVYPKLIEQTTQTIDALMKNPRHEAKDLLGKVMRDMPIIRGKYPIMLNAVGEPIHYDAVQMISTAKEDPFWTYMAKHNLSVGKPDQRRIFYDDISKTERAMTNDEYYQFVKTTGPEIKKRIEDEVIAEGLSDEDASKAVVNIKSDVRKNAMTEMFGWGQLRQDHPNDWKKIKDGGALQIPHSSEEIRTGREKVRIGKEKGIPSKELEDFNNTAMEEYRKRVIQYLDNAEIVKADKSKINQETGDSRFDEKVNAYWKTATAMAKGKYIESVKDQNKNK